ncbi:MAG TPA: SAM-dependent methyltransferase [Acidimicrobiales bacterium]
MSGDLASRLAERVARHGPISFEAFHEVALYDTEGGFYASGGQAGRRGDFLTSPEVGPLFGAVVARALDTWWDGLGRPDPFVVVDAGAGPGSLARAVLAAKPVCAGALRYVLVERSTAQRAQHAEGLPLAPPVQAFAAPHPDDDPDPAVVARGPLCVSLGEMPAGPFDGVVIANELLDNLPFRLLVNDGGWREAYVGVDGSRFVELLVPATTVPRGLPQDVPLGARAPLQQQAARWMGDALALVRRGRVIVFDYASSTSTMARQPWRQWLRTYRGHERGAHYLAEPGSQDITTEVALDQLAAVREPDAVRTQSQWLALHGIDQLVEEGRRVWQERAHLADLAAVRARSRIREAEALTDPAGLGAFTVAEWVLG